MSEMSTGTVALSVIVAPLAIGAALVVGAAYLANQYRIKHHEKFLKEIEESNNRLKWLDRKAISSPKQIAVEARELHTLVVNSKVFEHMTVGLTESQKESLAGAIVTEHSPLKFYVPSLLDKMQGSKDVFEVALRQGTKSLAMNNFNFVNNIVTQAALAAGFSNGTRILKQKQSVLDIVFSDRENRKFTAYCKLDKEMNPSLALDLEGFDCNSKECSSKMGEIIRYLQDHGVPFKYNRIRHNQPMGVLRKMLDKKSLQKQQEELKEYLQSGIQDVPDSPKERRTNV